jgi:hypothetical protein
MQYIYRVTRLRPKPEYYQSKHSTKVCTRKSVLAQLKADKHTIVMIERAPIGEWEEIETEEEIL